VRTGYFPQGNVALWTGSGPEGRATAYWTKSSGTRSPFPLLVWHALTASGFQISPADQRLLEITALDAVPEKPNNIAYSRARRVLELAELCEIEPTQITASADGGVALCFKVDGMYADIECFNSGELWGIISDRINPASTWAISNSPKEIIKSLWRIKSELNA